MKNKITFIAFLSILIFLSSLLNAEEMESKFTSSYTSIDEKDCLTLDSDDLGSIQECESFSDITVKVVEGDIRQSIILTRNFKEYILNFQSTITSSFSTLASKIEWRHERDNMKNLKGMIVRLEVNDNEEDLDATTSLLLVSKITTDQICIIGKILPQDKQNEVARKMLDNSDDIPCLRKSNKH